MPNTKKKKLHSEALLHEIGFSDYEVSLIKRWTRVERDTIMDLLYKGVMTYLNKQIPEPLPKEVMACVRKCYYRDESYETNCSIWQTFGSLYKCRDSWTFDHGKPYRGPLGLKEEEE